MRLSLGCAVPSVLAGAIFLSSCGRPAEKDFQKSLREQLISAKSGDVIDLPEGKFRFDRTLSLTGYTGVDFRLTQTDVIHWGRCKPPNSAGQVGALRYDLVPGHPEESILIYRLESTAPKVSMPALSRDVVHEEGVKLLREWIASLSGGCERTLAWHTRGDL
jgi:hypothetical protein